MSKDFPSLELFRKRMLSHLPAAQGALMTHDGDRVRPLIVGADGTIIEADSTMTEGLKYSTKNSILDFASLPEELDPDETADLIPIFDAGGMIYKVVKPQNIRNVYESPVADAADATSHDMKASALLAIGNDRYIATFADPAGDKKVFFQTDGNIDVLGGIYTGGASKSVQATNENVFNATKSGVLTTNINGVSCQLQIRPDTGSTIQPTGGSFAAAWEDFGTLSGTIGEVRGGFFTASMKKDDSGSTITNLKAGRFQANANETNTNAPNITNMIAVDASVLFLGTNYAINVARGLNIGTAAPGAGTVINNLEGIRINDLKAYGTVTDAMTISSQTLSGALDGCIRFAGGNWNTGHLRLGTSHIWFDGTTLRGKTSTPTGASDGADILAAGGGGGGDSFLEWGGL